VIVYVNGLQPLLVSDFGPKITIKIVENLREDILSGKLKSGSEIKVCCCGLACVVYTTMYYF
jgi:hypothetical protein